MDVRCENCQTVYDFDETRVKDAGVTVKCTQCGHIFKVRKRSPAARKRTIPGMPKLDDAAAPPTVASPPPAHVEEPSGRLPSGGPDRVWLLRLASTGEVRRFRELTTLQQWIVEKRVAREDEISRTGDFWKRLGAIAELQPFFRVVEQAARPDAAAYGATDPALPARSGTAPGVGPVAAENAGGGYAPPLSGESYDSARDWPAPPAADDGALTSPAERFDDDDDLEVPRHGIRGGTVLAAAAVLLLVGTTGYLAAFKRASIRALIAGDDGGRGREAYRKGREYFLLDTDEDFHQADQQLQRAQGADETNPLPVAALVELNVDWARLLRDDAETIAKSRPARVDELRRDAQAHLDEARRYANEARALAGDAPEVALAAADLLALDGAPTAQVEESLRKAEAKRADDPEVAFVRASLLLRDGKPDEARTWLEQANRLSQQRTHHDLLRADYQLARLDEGAGKADEARALARRILDANPRHERARALLARLDEATAAPSTAPAATGPSSAPAAMVAAADAAAAPTANAPAKEANAPGEAAPAKEASGTAKEANAVAKEANAPAEAAPAKAPAESGEKPAHAEPRGYEALVAAGNRYLEYGKGRDATRMFEKALVERPDGVDALLGLGYAGLDTEHFSAAVDKFNQVLQLAPQNGEAILGLAQTYKTRGDKARALSYYQRYLKELPGGSKASMAQDNVRDLQDALKSAPPSEPPVALPPPPPAATP